MSFVEPGTVIEGDESVFTHGYEVNGEEGLYPPGMLIGQVARFVPAENVTQEYVRGAARRRLRDPAVRARAAGQDGGREPVTRRVLVTIVVIVTALLLQSTAVLAAEAARRAPGADVPRHDRDRDPRGPERGRGHRVRGRPRPGLPAEPAQGHHGAHADARRLRRRARPPVHRLAVPADADDPRRGRHRRGHRVLSDRGVPARAAAGDVHLRGARDVAAPRCTERSSRRSSIRCCAG